MMRNSTFDAIKTEIPLAVWRPHVDNSNTRPAQEETGAQAMKFLTLAVPILAVLCFASLSKAEDAPKPDDTKPAEAKSAENKTEESPVVGESKSPDAKPADNGELPSAPTGNATVSTAGSNESLIGDISKGAPVGKGKAKNKKKGGSGDASALVLTVAHAKGKEAKKARKEGKTPKTVTLLASGDILSQLNAFADKHAHIKVTGTLNGDTLTVTEVAEAPAETAKKKKKNNA